MSPAGLSRPMRAAGFALLGVAAIATVIGVASAVSSDTPPDPSAGDGGNGQATSMPAPGGASPGPGTQRPGEQAPGEQAPGDTTVPAGPGESSAPGAADPSSSASRPGGTKDAPVADRSRSVPVRVYNNSTVKGLAGRAADDLRAQGWQVASVGNYAKGVIPATTVYYRPGTDEEAAARTIGSVFGMRVEPRFAGIEDSGAGVIVIVTRDYQGASGKY